MVKLLTIDFILKCIWKKNHKAFAYRVPIGDYNYLQCGLASTGKNAVQTLGKSFIKHIFSSGSYLKVIVIYHCLSFMDFLICKIDAPLL